MGLLKDLSFKRKITNLTLFSINACGVFPVKGQADTIVSYFWVVFATFAMLYMCGLSIVAPFQKKYEFSVNISIVLNVLTSLVCYCNPVISLFCRQSLVKLLELTDSGFYRYSDEDKFEVEEYLASKLLMREFYISAFVMVTYIGMTLSPLVVTLLLKEHENSAFDLLYVAWVPFGIKTGEQFFFSYIMQFISTLPLYTSFMSKILFINNVNREFEYQCDKLRFALRSIDARVSKKEIFSETDSTGKPIRTFIKCDEREFLQKLSECEAHYYSMQRYLKYFSIWFNPIFSCELSYGFISFALIGYLLIHGTGNNATDVKYVCLLGLFGGQLCYQCVAGEMFQTLKDNITNELYAMNWNDQTPKVKKNVQMFLHLLQQNQNLRGFLLFPASIEIFTSIVQTSYSYLNILNKIMHNKGPTETE